MAKENHKKQFSARLNQILDEAGIPPKYKGRQETVGKMFGISQKGARKWLEGESIPKHEMLLMIVDKFRNFGVTVEWLLSGNPSMKPDFIEGEIVRKKIGYSDSNKTNDIISEKFFCNVEPGPNITGKIPLISWVQAGTWCEIIDNLPPGQADEWRETTAHTSKNTYALRVRGDSMTNPYGSPSIPDGYIIIVDPNQQADNGDLVIARLEDSMEATFKKLVIDGSKRYLKPLNPSYPVIEINGNCTICGKVIRVEFDL